MNTLTARELNYMVYRYLQESGFQHSAFVFGHEAAIDKETSIDETSVPPGAIVTFVQKGIQYLEMEANLKIDEHTDVSEDFQFFKPFDLLNMNVNELKKTLEEQRAVKAAKELQILSKEKEREDRARDVMDKQKGKMHDDVNYKKLKESMAFGGSQTRDMSTPSTAGPFGHHRGVRSRDVLVLEGHSAEVCTCAWSPAGRVLASGSKDATARIWSIADRTNCTNVHNRLASVCVLRHSKPKPGETTKDISTLDWNLNGTLLATGSHDGFARIWHANGQLKSIVRHKGPVYSVKFNKKGDYLLTGGFDRSAIVWDVNANKVMQQFEFRTGSVLDVDWRTNFTFASGSTDGTIYVCKVGGNQPIKIFRGHTDEVNRVVWDPSGLLLASCSDDTTAKIWSAKQGMPVHDFKDHAKEIYTITWSPTGPATVNPNKQLLLASSSRDTTVKLWDVESGGLYSSLNGHRDVVYCVSFSPNGEYVASGSGDKVVNIWSVKDGKIVKTYFCNGGVSQVSWSEEGKKIAFSTRQNTVCVADFRK